MQNIIKSLISIAVVIVFIGIISTTGVSAATQKSIWEIATEVYHDDLESIQQWNISEGAKSLISKIFGIEYGITRGLFAFGEEAVEYISNLCSEDAVSMDIYSSVTIECEDNVISVQAEDEGIVRVAADGKKVRIIGTGRGQADVYISSIDRTDKITVTVNTPRRSVETYQVKVGKKRLVRIASLTDIQVSGYKLSKKTVLKSVVFDEATQALVFEGRKAGSCKIYLTTESGRTIRITVKVVDD